MVNKSFSIIIPTYTGEEYIEDCFESILNQKKLLSFDLELIVVIDGPNKSLRSKVEKAKHEFEGKGINFKILQFPRNRGRFEARFSGAKDASGDWLLFIDDRNVMAPNYLQEVTRLDKRAMIPNVLELSHPNSISRLLYLVRKKIYKNWGSDFISYDITHDNFDKSPKGTTSFWVPKELFIKVCNELSGIVLNTKEISDDTRIMRMIINEVPIYRSSEAKIYYQPRSSFWGELGHIYKRGPLFVDYYLRKSSPYFYLLIGLYFSLLIGGVILLVNPLLVLVLLGLGVVMVIVASVILYRVITDIPKIFVTAPLVAIVFSAGLVKGLFVTLYARVRR